MHTARAREMDGREWKQWKPPSRIMLFPYSKSLKLSQPPAPLNPVFLQRDPNLHRHPSRALLLLHNTTLVHIMDDAGVAYVGNSPPRPWGTHHQGLGAVHHQGLEAAHRQGLERHHLAACSVAYACTFSRTKYSIICCIASPVMGTPASMACRVIFDNICRILIGTTCHEPIPSTSSLMKLRRCRHGELHSIALFSSVKIFHHFLHSFPSTGNPLDGLLRKGFHHIRRILVGTARHGADTFDLQFDRLGHEHAKLNRLFRLQKVLQHLLHRADRFLGEAGLDSLLRKGFHNVGRFCIRGHVTSPSMVTFNGPTGGFRLIRRQDRRAQNTASFGPYRSHRFGPLRNRCGGNCSTHQRDLG